MQISRGQLVWGVTLILLGALIFAQQQGLINALIPFWVWVFGGLGLLFLLTALTDWSKWGFVYPGFSSLGIGAVIFLATNTRVSGNVIGAIFLGSVALPFWFTLLLQRRHWWAIIPGGSITVLAVMPLLVESGASAQLIGAVFFLGLGATFALVRLWTIRDRRMAWAWYPALILALFGLVIFGLGDSNVWPLVLILIGLVILIRAFIPRRRPRPAESTDIIAKG